MNIKIIVIDYQNKNQADDLVKLLDIYAKEPMGGNSPLGDFTKQNLITSLSKIPHAFSIIAYVDEQPAGLTNCFETFSTFKCKPLINIHDVIVDKQFRGLKLSQLMLEKVEKIAKQRGCCKVTLEVLEGNKIAQNAYIKAGYQGYELDPKMGKAMFWEKPLG